MRLLDYPKAQTVGKDSTYLITDSADAGTKAIKVGDLRKEFMDVSTRDEYYNFLDNIGIDYVTRRNIYRGKNLGSAFTAEQRANIADGKFRGFFIGDYWEINGTKYRIADINYWIWTGDTVCNTYHLVIVPDTGLGEPKPMNDTNTTEGGYLGCKFSTNYYVESRDLIQQAFGGSKILGHRDFLSNAVTNGYPSGAIWTNTGTGLLLNEPMVYGSYIITPGSTGTVTPFRYTIDKTQLALFKLHPEFICIQRQSYWLRDVVSATTFAAVSGYGNSHGALASTAWFIRPVFGIIG